MISPRIFSSRKKLIMREDGPKLYSKNWLLTDCPWIRISTNSFRMSVIALSTRFPVLFILPWRDSYSSLGDNRVSAFPTVSGPRRFPLVCPSQSPLSVFNYRIGILRKDDSKDKWVFKQTVVSFSQQREHLLKHVLNKMMDTTYHSINSHSPTHHIIDLHHKGSLHHDQHHAVVLFAPIHPVVVTNTLDRLHKPLCLPQLHKQAVHWEAHEVGNRRHHLARCNCCHCERRLRLVSLPHSHLTHVALQQVRHSIMEEVHQTVVGLPEPIAHVHQLRLDRPPRLPRHSQHTLSQGLHVLLRRHQQRQLATPHSHAQQSRRRVLRQVEDGRFVVSGREETTGEEETIEESLAGEGEVAPELRGRGGTGLRSSR